jgi:hypothetical protein
VISKSYLSSSYLSRRQFLPSLLVFAGIALSDSPRNARAQSGRPTVNVFLQVDAKSIVVEKTLQERMPELQIRVFGRFRDFEEAMTTARPDAVLSIAPVLEQFHAAITLQGLRAGKPAEAYVLASVNQPLDGQLTGKTIGVVDILGRDGTQTFLSALLKEPSAKVKRVVKVEDLLPLLEFSAADGIVLPGSMVARLTERTRLVIKTKSVAGAPVGLPAVSVLNPAVRQSVIKSFQGLDAATRTLLGLDSWSAR